MKFKSLEAFRGLAALFVILFHSLFTTSTLSVFRMNSHLFVDFFFILSGFIISYSYLNRLQTHEVKAKTFILKRIFRLYPLHLFMLFIWLLYIIIKHEAFVRHIGGQDPYLTHTVISFVEHLFLVQAWGTGNIMSWNVPSWSISVEIMAYIVFLVFVLSFQRTGNAVKVLFSTFIIVSLKSLLILYPGTFSDYAFLINGLSAFFIGVIVYIIYTYIPKSSLSTISVSIIEVLLFLGIFFVLSSDLHSHTLVNSTQLIFAVTIYFFATQERGVISKVLQHKTFQYLGLLSYSIYMIHALVVEVTGHIFEYLLKYPSSFEGSRKILVTEYADLINVSMIVFVIVLAHVTYNYIEQPARHKLTTLIKKDDED